MCILARSALPLALALFLSPGIERNRRNEADEGGRETERTLSVLRPILIDFRSSRGLALLRSLSSLERIVLFSPPASTCRSYSGVLSRLAASAANERAAVASAAAALMPVDDTAEDDESTALLVVFAPPRRRGDRSVAARRMVFGLCGERGGYERHELFVTLRRDERGGKLVFSLLPRERGRQGGFQVMLHFFFD